MTLREVVDRLVADLARRDGVTVDIVRQRYGIGES